MTEIYHAAPDRYAQADSLYRRCRQSGVLLPKVSLGFWQNFGAVNDYERSRSIALYAFDRGITHFDLANNYGPPAGSAEETLGRILQKDLMPHRHELFIATKAGYDMWEGPYGNWGSRKHLITSLDQSLRRMKLDYVDLFYSHRFDPQTPLEETLQALADVVRSGKALYIGISRWPLEALQKAYSYLTARDIPFLTVQDRLNLLDRKPQSDGTLAFCREHQLGFVAFSPLAQGLLTDRYLNGVPAQSRMARSASLKESVLTPELLGYLQQLNRHAAQRGESLSQMALAWVLAQKGVTSVLVGASSVEQLATNLKCIQALPFTGESL